MLYFLQVEPKRKKLEEAEIQLHAAEANLEEKQVLVHQLQATPSTFFYFLRRHYAKCKQKWTRCRMRSEGNRSKSNRLKRGTYFVCMGTSFALVQYGSHQASARARREACIRAGQVRIWIFLFWACCLFSEEIRWKEQAEKLDVDLKNVVGNILLSAATIAYQVCCLILVWKSVWFEGPVLCSVSEETDLFMESVCAFLNL